MATLIKTISPVIKSLEHFKTSRESWDSIEASIVLLRLDLSEFGNDQLWKNAKLLSRMYFIDCIFPSNVTKQELEEKYESFVWNSNKTLPFETFRTSLYTQEDLAKNNQTIYDYFVKNRNLWHVEKAFFLHDFALKNVLIEFIQNRKIIGVMGGRALKRQSDAYRSTVFLSKRLTESGFTMLCGGGGGAMEATSLGAYLAGKSDEATREALTLIGKGNENFPNNEWFNTAPALEVLKRFGPANPNPNNNFCSLAVPTWLYGTEPTNKFCTYICKFFSKAEREDILLELCNHGCLFVPGSFGTRQEIFQFACINADMDRNAPAVFFDKKFWGKIGMDVVMEKTMQPNSFLFTDEIEEVLNTFKGTLKPIEQTKQ